MSWSQVPTFLRDKEGRVYMNPAKDYVQPFELPIDNPNEIVRLAAGGRRGPFPLTAKYDGPIECFYIKACVYADDDGDVAAPVTSYDIDFFLEHPGKRIQFSNRFIPLYPLAGDGGRPYVLPETIFIPPVQSLNITLVNNDLVNARHVEFVMGGIKMYPNAAPKEIRDEVWKYIERRERTYTYWATTDDPLDVPADSELPGFVTIPDSADLEILKLSAQSEAAFRAKIIDGQNDRALTGSYVHGSLLFGGHIATAMGGGLGGSGGVWPARWPTSWLMRRATKSQFNVKNLDTANANTVKLVLGGRKVSYVG